jgi:molybdenum cofactor sulfurtransferase
MNGERLPLDWAGKLRFSSNHPNSYTLLDVAALVSTTPLDLSNHLSAPDFVTLSFYKIFGFPDLGALIVRKAAGHVFDHRRYFGGGTTEMTTCIGDVWVARKDSSLHARLEDGTIAFRSILALKIAIATHHKLFGGLGEVSKHTSWLAKKLYQRLVDSKHFNGMPVYRIYKSADSSYDDSTTQGATVAFNVCRSDGSYLGPWHVGSFLRKYAIHVRTGNLCNPAGISCALEMNAEWLRAAFERGYRCNTELDIVEGKPVGVVRITFGAANTVEDVEKLVSALSQHILQEESQLQDVQRKCIEKKDSVMGYRENEATVKALEARSELMYSGEPKLTKHTSGIVGSRRHGLRRLLRLILGKQL